MPSRIVFVNQATGYLTIDIINAFAKEFDEVAFIYGDLRIQDVALHPKARGSKVVEKSRRSNTVRFLRWFIATIQIFFLLLSRYRKYEIFYFSVPPFAYFSSLFFKRKFSVLMWDVYPDALKLAGIKENSFLYNRWAAINNRLFMRAHRIFTIGDGQAKLLQNYTHPGRVEVIKLWPGLRNISPVPKDANPFIADHSLSGKFIVEYSGNMGGTQNIEVLVDIAEILSDQKDIMFLLIGRGTKMEVMRGWVERKGLANVMMLPFQPDNIIRYSLSSADLNVVLVEEGAASVSVPSKIYNLLAVGSPILAITPDNSEVSLLMNKYKPGKHFRENDIQSIAEFIIEMKQSPDKLNMFRNNSFNASRDFTASNARKFVDSYLAE